AHLPGDAPAVIVRGDTAWARCDKSRPCPLCGKPDWCALGFDARTRAFTAVLCGRVEVGHKHITENGYLHEVADRDLSALAPAIAFPTKPDPKLSVKQARAVCA